MTESRPHDYARMPRVDIDRGALQRNWRRLDAMAPNARTGAAVKANGYGLGAAEVAGALFDAGCRDFFVAWPQEGVELRKALDANSSERPRIFVLQGIEPRAVGDLLTAELTPVLSSISDIAIWAEGLAGAASNPSAALQLETGMNRLGLSEKELTAAKARIDRCGLRISLVLSHLASADECEAQSEEQSRRFGILASGLQHLDAELSLANSAGILRASTHHFDLTRPGIALYGGMRAGGDDGSLFEPVATLTASVLQVRTADAGERAGYGGAAHLSRPTRIATVGLGYADGYLRALSGNGIPSRPHRAGPVAIVGEHRVPVIGRISMDLTLLDVTDVPPGRIQPGERAEFYGPGVSIESVAEAGGTIPYELLTGLGPRVYRSWGEGSK